MTDFYMWGEFKVWLIRNMLQIQSAGSCDVLIRGGKVTRFHGGYRGGVCVCESVLIHHYIIFPVYEPTVTWLHTLHNDEQGHTQRWIECSMH